MLERHISRAVLHVLPDGVPMAEGAPLGVLTGETNGRPIDEKAADREKFCTAPIDLARSLDHLHAPMKKTRQLRIEMEPVWNSRGRLDDLLEALAGHAGG